MLETVAEYVLNTWPERKTGTIDGVQKNKHINIVTGQTEAFRFNGDKKCPSWRWSEIWLEQEVKIIYGNV